MVRLLLLCCTMPAGTVYFHKQPSYFYISFPTDFFDYRIFLLLSGKQSGHIFHISHKALFSQQLPLPSFGVSVHKVFPVLLFHT